MPPATGPEQGECGQQTKGSSTCTGTEGCVPGAASLCIVGNQYSCSPTHRQHNGDRLSEQERGHSLSEAVGPNCPGVGVVPDQEDHPARKTYTRQEEERGGQRVEKRCGPQRLDALSRGVPGDLLQMGTSGCRPLRCSSKRPDAQVLHLQAGPSGGGSGNSGPEVDSTTPVCLPSVHSTGSCVAENTERQSPSGKGDSASMAKPALVSHANREHLRPATDSTSDLSPAD